MRIASIGAEAKNHIVKDGLTGAAQRRWAVPSKTHAQHVVHLSPSAVAERRVDRLKRSVWASGHLHGMAEKGFRPGVPWFVTLTYAKADGWHKTHLSAAVKRFRNWCRSHRVPCRYTWVGEIQPKRLERTGDAVVHYHLLAWLPVGVRMPFWDKDAKLASGKVTTAFWTHGMAQTEIAKSGVGYLMKYLSKLGELTRFPKGLRLYGVGGLCELGRKVRAWYNLPEWVKRSYGVGEVYRKCSSLIARATGEILEPAYKVTRIPSGLFLTALRELPPRFHDGAYSSWPAA